MKRFVSTLLMFCIVGVTSIGCSEKASSTKKTTTSDPGGTTTTKTTQEVEKSGDNPPAPK